MTTLARAVYNSAAAFVAAVRAEARTVVAPVAFCAFLAAPVVAMPKVTFAAATLKVSSAVLAT